MNNKVRGIALANGGLVTTAHTRSAGLPVDVLRSAARRGELERIHRGIYRLPGTRTFLQDVMAACLAAGPGAVSSGRTAAQIWELPVAPGDQIDVIGRQVRRETFQGVAVRRALVDPADVCRFKDVPILRPAALVLDLAGRVDQVEVEDAMDEFLRRGTLSLDALHRRVQKAHLERRPRAGWLLSSVVDRRDGVPESVLEAAFLRALKEVTFPLPVRQPEIGKGRGSVRPDFGYLDQRVAVDLDGERFHTSRTSRKRDKERSNLLEAMGWKHLVFDWWDVHDRKHLMWATLGRTLNLVPSRWRSAG